MAKIGIVGGGFSGLTAANYLAKEGHEVTVFEKHYVVGGGAMSWQKPVPERDVWYWGESIHVLSHLDSGKELRKTLEGAGLDFDTVVGELTSPANFTRAVTLEGEAVMPNSDTEFESMLRGKFPEESRGIERFFQDLRALNQERHADTHPGWRKALLDSVAKVPSYLSFLNIPAQGICRPRLARNYLFRPTWKKALESYFTDPHLTSHFHHLNGYFGLRSEECASNLAMVAYAFYLIDGGAQMPKHGSFQKILNGLVDALHQKGGKVYTNACIEDLVITKDKVETLAVKSLRNGGQRTQGRTHRLAPRDEPYCFGFDEIVWTADPNILVAIAEEKLPRSYTEKIRTLRVSTGLTGFHALVDSRLEQHADVFDVASLVVAPTFADLDFPERELYLTAPSLHRQGLVVDRDGMPVKGFHVLNFYVMDNQNEQWIKERKKSGGNKPPYRTHKEAFVDERLKIIDEVLGTSIRDYIIQRNILTPATSARYMNTPGGGVYGAACTPGQFVPHNLSKTTPLENLTLASHWTFGAGGVPAALNEGKAAAKIVCDKIG